MNDEHQLAQALLRAWPFPRGAGRLLDRYFSTLTFSCETAIVRTSDDFEISVFPNELIGRHIYLTGEFDRSIVELLCKFAEPGDTLLDIGANIGYVSACFLNNVANSNTLAVEPQSEVLPLLTTNLNRFGRFQIYPFALCDNDGEAWFEVNWSNMGAGRIVGGCGARTMKVETRSADSMFSSLNISKLDLVKIDAEGSEWAILQSCREYFRQLQPRAIIFEDNNSNATDAAALLNQIGYRVFGIRKRLCSLELVEDAGGCHDYIAVSKSRALPETAKRYGIL